MISDIHIFFLHAGDIKLGGDLSCENVRSKSGLDKRVDCCDSHPRAIRRILEFHTTQKVVVSFSPSHGWAQRTHIDRCLLRGGAGEGTRVAGCVDGSKGKPLRGECIIGGDLSLCSDLIFEGEVAISRSLALRTALHTRSIDSASLGVAGPDELVDACEQKGVENGSGAIGRFRGRWRLSDSLSSPELAEAGCAAKVLSNASQECKKS